jgi:hypothetical protein
VATARRRVLGDEHAETLVCVGNLASLCLFDDPEARDRRGSSAHADYGAQPRGHDLDAREARGGARARRRRSRGEGAHAGMVAPRDGKSRAHIAPVRGERVREVRRTRRRSVCAVRRYLVLLARVPCRGREGAQAHVHAPGNFLRSRNAIWRNGIKGPPDLFRAKTKTKSPNFSPPSPEKKENVGGNVGCAVA